MKMRSVLSILLAVCLMASFVFCLPVQVQAAEDSAGEAGGTDTATDEGPSAWEAWWINGLAEPVSAMMQAFDNLVIAVLRFVLSAKNAVSYFILSFAA